MRARHVILFATWSGLVAGSANALWVLGQWLAGVAVFADRPYLWMAPLATTAVFIVLSFPVAGLAVLRRGGVPDRLVTFGFSLLALVSALLPVGQLHPFASIMLAAGAASMLSQAMVSPVRRRWVLAGGLVGVVAPALLAAAIVRFPPRLARDQDPPAGAPNILLLILDTVRADALSAYGAPYQTTPRLDSLSRSAAFFQWAFSPSSWTLPSHASFFTGYPPEKLSPRWNWRLDNEQATLAEVLGRAGWRTGGFVGNQAYAAWGSGLARGFDEYWASPISGRQLAYSVTLAQLPLVHRFVALVRGREYSGPFASLGLKIPFVPLHFAGAAENLRRFAAWRAKDRARPFFAFVNLMEAHEEGMVPEQWARRFNNGTSRRDRYLGKVAWQDSVVGALLGTLSAEGILDRTLVVVTSDHGENFRHNLNSHGFSLYLGGIRVPLIVRFPAQQHVVRTVTTPVSLQDLPATVLDVAGLPPTMPGRSWRRWFAESTGGEVMAALEQSPPPVEAPALHGPLRSLIDERWHCIQHADGRMQVFEYRVDPHEEKDLATTREGRSVASRCGVKLKQHPSGYEVAHRGN